MSERTTYKDAGVDVELADRVIGSLADRIKATHRPEVIGKMGGFAAMVQPDWSKYQAPVLVSGADGVGTKLKIAFLTGIHDTVGIDLVAMNVNDILVTGAEPLFFLDYLATGKLEPSVVSSVISGIAAGCEQANCSLVGGETAEMPDFYPPGEYDLAGFCVGVLDKARSIDGSAIEPGQVLIGLASSGVHSNGFSLVRKVLLERKGFSVSDRFEDLGKTLGEELLTPTRIYVRPALDVMGKATISGMVHITGGGFFGNIPRVLPDNCDVEISKDKWETPPIFNILAREAGLDDTEMFGTFNMGIGFIMIAGSEQAQTALSELGNAGVPAYVIGEVIPRRNSGERVTLS